MGGKCLPSSSFRACSIEHQHDKGGKATAFLGPVVVGLVTAASGSQRVGLASLLAFFAIGLTLLFGVREPTQVDA